jgi:hypothetical protein
MSNNILTIKIESPEFEPKKKRNSFLDIVRRFLCKNMEIHSWHTMRGVYNEKTERVCKRCRRKQVMTYSGWCKVY